MYYNINMFLRSWQVIEPLIAKHRTVLRGRLILSDPGLKEPGLREIPLLDAYYTECPKYKETRM